MLTSSTTKRPSKGALGDMRKNVADSAQIADSRFAGIKKSRGSARRILNVPVTVNKKERKRSTLSEPRDFADMAAMERDPGADPNKRGTYYRQIEQPIGPGGTPTITGRVQDPQNKNAADDERFSYIQGDRGAPSYPTAAKHLSDMGKAHGLEPHEMIGRALDIPFGGSPGQDFSPKELSRLASPMMINNISEQRRSPSMAFFSAQAMDYASDKSSGVSMPDLWGVKKGKVNEPGLAPATGTGAKGVWKKQVEPSLSEDAMSVDPPDLEPDEKGQRVLDNIESTHQSMMERHYDPFTQERLTDEGMSQDDIDTALRIHMNSFARRKAAIATGQLRPMRTRVTQGFDLKKLKQDKDARRDSETHDKRAKSYNKNRLLPD